MCDHRMSSVAVSAVPDGTRPRHQEAGEVNKPTNATHGVQVNSRSRRTTSGFPRAV